MDLTEFNDIAPFNDEETAAALTRLANHPNVPWISRFIFPDKPETFLAEVMRGIKTVDEFQVGDTVKVYCKIKEGNRERVQVFEGVVIARSGAGVRETFTVRRIASGVGVERTFPVHSPRLDKIEVKRRGVVRRAKLYYLRNLTGKAARIREKR